MRVVSNRAEVLLVRFEGLFNDVVLRLDLSLFIIRLSFKILNTHVPLVHSILFRNHKVAQLYKCLFIDDKTTMKEVRQHKGIHGTAKYHADSILKSGISVEKTKLGRLGQGFYLWKYSNQKAVGTAKMLAENWYNRCHKQQLYRGRCDKENSFACLDVSFYCDEAEILDFTNPEILESFYIAYPMGEFSIEGSGTLDDPGYGACIREFLIDLEKEIQEEDEAFSFKAILAMCATQANPKRMAMGNYYSAYVIVKNIELTLKQIY